MSLHSQSPMNTANKVLVLLFYGAYGVLLVLAAVEAVGKALVLLVVPAVGFGLVSAVRAGVNAPRPYDNGGPDPLIARDGEGKSFPSRHSFSAFTIATCWCVECAAVAVVLFGAAVALATLRVKGGVHYPRDVVAGALCGVGVGVVTVLLCSA